MYSATEVKRGSVLLRDSRSGNWCQRLIAFDPVGGRIQFYDPLENQSLDFSIPNRARFNVKTSPYLLPQYPTALTLHLFPVQSESCSETDLHVATIDLRDIQDWSYYLQNWVSTQPDGSNQFSSVIPNLSEKEESKSEFLLAPSGAYDTQTVLVDKFNIPVTRKTLQCLRDGEWLSDEVVNFYFSMMQEKSNRKIFCWNSFFYSKLSSSGYMGVRNWTSRRNIDLFDLSQVEVLLIPVHVVDHWALGVVDMMNKMTVYLDSLGSDSVEFHSTILAYLQSEFAAKHPGQDMAWNAWSRKTASKTLPLQSNGSDCGIFICMYALALASGNDFSTISTDRVPVMRRRIACDIARGKIKKWPAQD